MFGSLSPRDSLTKTKIGIDLRRKVTETAHFFILQYRTNVEMIHKIHMKYITFVPMQSPKCSSDINP